METARLLKGLNGLGSDAAGYSEQISPFEGIIQKRRKAMSNLSRYKKREVPNVD
jgi:hypothetical protein